MLIQYRTLWRWDKLKYKCFCFPLANEWGVYCFESNYKYWVFKLLLGFVLPFPFGCDINQLNTGIEQLTEVLPSLFINPAQLSFESVCGYVCLYVCQVRNEHFPVYPWTELRITLESIINCSPFQHTGTIPGWNNRLFTVFTRLVWLAPDQSGPEGSDWFCN